MRDAARREAEAAEEAEEAAKAKTAKAKDRRARAQANKKAKFEVPAGWKHTRDKAGKELCFGFNRQSGCNLKTCFRLHLCAICLQKHSAVDHDKASGSGSSSSK